MILTHIMVIHLQVCDKVSVQTITVNTENEIIEKYILKSSLGLIFPKEKLVVPDVVFENLQTAPALKSGVGLPHQLVSISLKLAIVELRDQHDALVGTVVHIGTGGF